jgi:hypothetical protein
MGSKKRKNQELRNSYKTRQCLACYKTGTDFNPVDPAHVRTFKLSQSDDPRNIIPLCRQCHIEQHKSWYDFLQKHKHIKEYLLSIGWEILPKTGGGLYLLHPDIK